jgi:hypothetical protein
MVRKATIAEVKPEKVRIWFLRNASHMLAVAITMVRFLPLGEDHIDSRRDPPPQRCSRHAGAAGRFGL